MRCSYKHKADCKYIDTAGMTKTRECIDCDWYNNGTVESRGTPILEYLLNIFKKKNNK